MNLEQREKYSRQIIFPAIGEAGQERLLGSSAVLVGCGALGTVTANLLVRAGIGRLRIVDRDFVEMSNLQRQALFEEADARASLPKAAAAERRLRAINSDAEVEGIVSDLTPANIEELISGFPLILDGTDNFETRLLMNDAAISLGIPWIYGAAVGSYGVTMTIRPGETTCLACLLEVNAGSDGESNGGATKMAAGETCDTSGVLSSATSVIASIQATEAIKFLSGNAQAMNPRLISCDVWTGRFQSIRVERNPRCRACARRDFTYLTGDAQPHITLCGRDSVQIHERCRTIDLVELGKRLRAIFAADERNNEGHEARDNVRGNEFLLRFSVPPYEITVFADGRALVKGTQDPAVARSLYARFIGS